MLSFLNNHLPVLMAARIDATDVVFSEASFKSGVGGGGGGGCWPGRATSVLTNWTLLPL